MTFRSTFLPLESERILPWATRMIVVQSTLSVRPYRLWVDPEIGSGFLINNVLVGNLSVFPARGAVRASKFSIGQGDRLDGYVVPDRRRAATVSAQPGPPSLSRLMSLGRRARQARTWILVLVWAWRIWAPGSNTFRR